MTAATRTFSLSDFDFALPPELIAQHPAPERSASRLLDGRAATPVDRVFRELPGLLRAGDLVVFNNTQVVKARLFGEKSSGGKVELLVERVLQNNEVVAHMVLGYYDTPTAEPLILDNLIGNIRPGSSRTDLQPVFSFNAAGLWVAGATASSGDPTARLSRWRDVLDRMKQEGL